MVRAVIKMAFDQQDTLCRTIGRRFFDGGGDGCVWNDYHCLFSRRIHLEDIGAEHHA